MSIRFRLTLWYTLILAVTLLLFGVLLYFFTSTITSNQYKDILNKHTEKVFERIGFGLSPSLSGWDLDLKLDDVDTFNSKKIYLQLVNLTSLRDSDQAKVSRSTNAIEDQIFIPFSQATIDQAQDQYAFFESTKIHGYPFLIYNYPIVLQGQLIGILQGMMVTNEFLADFRRIFIMSSLLTLILASSLGWFLARQALRPIDDVISAAERIEKGADLSNRIAYEGPNDEVGRLVHKINGMLSRIETMYSELDEAYRMQRRFVSDASHELRTPLTTIRGNVELIHKMQSGSSANLALTEQEKDAMSSDAIRDIAEEAERMSRLVHHLLSLARADAGYEISKELVLLKPLVEGIVRKSQFLPRSVDLIVDDLNALDDVAVMGNEDYLKQMLFIFIENAFKYTEEGYVEIKARLLEDQVGIQITDTGIGMDKEDMPHIFERFYRADLSRGKTLGTGLGLAIAKWIIDEHDGSIEVSTKQSEGTSFIIWLPVYFIDESAL